MLRSIALPAARCACAQTASCLQGLPQRRHQSSTAPAPPGSGVDHYATLGIRHSASLDDVKRAFREQAKLYHPDVARATTNEAEALARFKLINEAYSILGDADLRRNYDREHAPKRRRAGATIQERNEGVYGGVPPVEPGKLGDEEAEREAFRSAMARAAEKQREGQRNRAVIARQGRAKVEIGERGQGPSWSTIFPVAVAALWAVNMMLFGR